MNLLNNAFKWSPPGGTVTIAAEEKDDAVIIRVIDTGPGISEENRDKVFEIYYRVEHERSPMEWLGLGLALCKGIVKLHGGKIWIDSNEGKGSTFSFSIPLWSTDDRQ